MAQSSVEKPTFLIIHGAWQTPLFYEDLIGHLEFLGYDSTCPHLPSCKETPDSAFRSITLADDAAFIKAEAARLVQAAGKTVFVVLHSYGGIVGDEALTDGLSYLRRRQLGLKGGIIGLYFVSAYLLRVGESWVDRFDGSNASQDPEVSPDCFHIVSMVRQSFLKIMLFPKNYLTHRFASAPISTTFSPARILIPSVERRPTRTSCLLDESTRPCSTHDTYITCHTQCASYYSVDLPHSRKGSRNTS